MAVKCEWTLRCCYRDTFKTLRQDKKRYSYTDLEQGESAIYILLDSSENWRGSTELIDRALKGTQFDRKSVLK